MAALRCFLLSNAYIIIKLKYRYVKFSTTLNRHLNSQEKQVQINDWRVNWFQVGNGPHHVLCVPGAFGTAWMDFKPQLEGFDRDKFTLVAYDTPGFGKSNPPARNFFKDLHHTDADISYKLMKAIGIAKYSLMGWCFGGTASIIHTANYPEAVEKLVIWGSQSHILPREFVSYENATDLLKISPDVFKTRNEYYGKETTDKYLAALVQALILKYKPLGGDICSSLLPHIHCPTLVMYGTNDTIVDSSHITYLGCHIKNSRTYIYENGKHNIHLRFPEAFNRRVQDFLLEPGNAFDMN